VRISIFEVIKGGVDADDVVARQTRVTVTTSFLHLIRSHLLCRALKHVNGFLLPTELIIGNHKKQRALV
jgi:hypothetical protein